MRASGWIIVCSLLAACGQAPQPAQAPLAATLAPGPAKGGAFDIRTPEGDRIVAPNLTERRALYDVHDGHIPVGMPIRMLQRLSDREVRDITAWLRSLPWTIRRWRGRR